MPPSSASESSSSSGAIAGQSPSPPPSVEAPGFEGIRTTAPEVEVTVESVESFESLGFNIVERESYKPYGFANETFGQGPFRSEAEAAKALPTLAAAPGPEQQGQRGLSTGAPGSPAPNPGVTMRRKSVEGTPGKEARQSPSKEEKKKSPEDKSKKPSRKESGGQGRGGRGGRGGQGNAV